MGGARIDAAEVAGQREPGQLGDGAGDLDAGGPAADDDGGHQRLLLLGIGRGLGKLEGHQQARADRPGVVDRFQPRRVLRPAVVAEVGVDRAGGENQPVVGDEIAVGEEDRPAGLVDADHLAHHHVDVRVAAEDLADRLGDLGRRQGGSADLVEQRNEQVVVVAVDHGDADVGAAQLPGAGEAAEASADDDDVVIAGDRCRREIQP